MDRTDNIGLYYDCLYYRVNDSNAQITSAERNAKKWDQIISYCFRPYSEPDEINNKITEGNVSSELTFEELRKKQVTTEDLLFWSASIDVVERYDDYLNSSLNDSLRSERFYNCSLSWFGPFCRYTFDTYSRYNASLSFHVIVNSTFVSNSFLNTSNMTCYLHLECNRGPAPACLDWREICDGEVDCLGSEVDEMDCFQLELNECEEKEFRCHNGMCIPEEFLNEGSHYPDCLDGMDEEFSKYASTRMDISRVRCSKEPGYWCEETNFAKHSRFFVCGDGQHSDETIMDVQVSWINMQCRNSRDIIMKKALLSYIEHPDLSYDCWFLLYCTTVSNNELDCEPLCENDDGWNCYINVTEKCRTDFAIFPQRPILYGHVYLLYLTNRTIPFIYGEVSLFPDYVCYDVRKCPFLPSTSLLNINDTICRSTEEFGLHKFLDIVHFFRACFVVIEERLANNRTLLSSLFQCPGTAKYISKHRVLDGVPDCFKGADEIDVDACSWNDKYRFRCPLEQKCLSPISVQNAIEDCLGGADEFVNDLQGLVFQKLCNGFEHLSPILIGGLNETDETHCDYWPCNNLYTRCDGGWNCLNGADELNCVPNKCPRDTHECVSPQTRKVMCLPFHQADNGVIDCFGATDERAYCRSQYKGLARRYRCRNETFCIISADACNGNPCYYEKWTECSKDVELVFRRLDEDIKLQSPDREYFMLKFSIANLSDSLPTISEHKIFSIRRTETCNRGVLIYVGSQLTVSCLCPPSYFGDRCQYQSDRVSLSLRFSRICTPDCQGIFGILLTLIDEDNVIHDHEQVAYKATHQCENRYFIYLLYRSRPKDMNKTYHVRIDAHNKMNLTYYASWVFPIKFLFLPVNRVAAHLFIPAYSMPFISNCSIYCGHGECFAYVNRPDQYFCHCHSNWSGVNCTIPRKCSCSSESRCLGHANNQSICLCTLGKYGARCRLPSICRNNTCKNGGVCVVDDARVSRDKFICICLSGFSGPTCEQLASEIHVSFHQMEIPRFLLIHCITVQNQADPLRTTIPTKVPFDRDIALARVSISFHLIIAQILDEYFLIFLNATFTSAPLLSIQLESKQKCPHIRHLFRNETIQRYLLLRRVKYYHLLCQNQSKLKCFHDNEEYFCLCNDEGFANCFRFDFNTTFTCQRRGECQNGAQCLLDRSNCPQSIFCICTDCFYGSKCQFHTKGFGLSLDAILGYQIRPNLPVNRQLFIVKMSIAGTIMMLVLSLINSTISIMTFQRKMQGESGCRQYLLVTSIVSLCIAIVFSIKFLMLILSHMSLVTHMVLLQISCISIDFLLHVGLIIYDWINASVAADRVLAVMMGVKFNVNKSKRAVRWVIIGIVLVSICSILHDPVHRRVIDDQEEERRWCLVQYSSSTEMYNSAITIIHFIGPFIVNLFGAIIIIFVAARTRSKTRQQKSYRELLREQFDQHKHLVISSIVLVILATPRLIISFIPGCMKSARDPSLYLAGYFISFIPPSLTFFVFALPSKTYMKEFREAAKKLRNTFRR